LTCDEVYTLVINHKQ